MPLKTEQCELLRDFFNHLVEVRSLDATAWLPWLKRIEEDYDDYQEAATFMAFVLPVPQQRLVPPGLVKVAREVVWAVSGISGLPSQKNATNQKAQKTQLKPYLAGGGAIAMHGGRRPVNDLDFNLLARPQLVNFAEGDGPEILKQLNTVVLPRLREVREAEVQLRKQFGSSKKIITDFEPFQVLGRPVTIGTPNWFGVEVSLSLIEPDLARIKPPVVSERYGLTLLDLTDLYNDKLKTVITRRKSGENSLKKVSQDLFDALMVAEMLARESGEDPELSQQMLLTELRRRMPGYLHHNLEHVALHEVADDDLADRMLERLVRTAQAHVRDGERRDRMTSLAHGYALDILQYVESLSEVDYTPTTLPGEQPDHLEQWFTSWNTGPRYGAPRAGDLPKRPSAKLFPGDAFVPDILAAWPPVEKITVTVDGKSLSLPCRQILTVLCRVEGGFRALADSRDDVQVFCAFRMTPTHFYNNFKTLEKAGLVESSDLGLTVTSKGLQVYRDAVLAQPVPQPKSTATLDERLEQLDENMDASEAKLVTFEAALNTLGEDFDETGKALDRLYKRFAEWSEKVDALAKELLEQDTATVDK